MMAGVMLEHVPTYAPTIEAILTQWRPVLGWHYRAYANHVYRVYTYCIALADHVEGLEEQVAIAAAFHDLAIWSQRTLEHQAMSAQLARDYLQQLGRPDWETNITRMILHHHQILPYYQPGARRLPARAGENSQLIEAFRRADLIDLSAGALTFGLPRSFIQATRRAFPLAGFYRALARQGVWWSLCHPLRPLPMLHWRQE